MSEYLLKKKSIFDALAHTGYVVSDEDKIMYVLSGLGAEYDPFVILVTSTPNLYTLPEITALLLTHEAIIEQHNQVESLNVNMAVNKKGNNSGGNSQSSYGRGNNQASNNTGNNGGRTSQGSNGGKRGRGKGKYNNNNKIFYKICRRMGHEAYR
ncbi:hypothetical protein ACOSQ2_021296 [Xanthoceras sorbifolium]